jgi:hypothetical protein
MSKSRMPRINILCQVLRLVICRLFFDNCSECQIFDNIIANLVVRECLGLEVSRRTELKSSNMRIRICPKIEASHQKMRLNIQVIGLTVCGGLYSGLSQG